MQKNGFIFIALLLATVSRAGSPWYLPAVGPVVLRLDVNTSAKPLVHIVSPPHTANSEPPKETTKVGELIAELPVEVEPPTTVTSNDTIMHNPPVVEPPKPIQPPQIFIGPMMDTNNIITPQMLMRYFTPVLNGTSRESVIIPHTGFTPANPPSASSTVNYTQPK
jgi:hypothetical protein